MSALITTTDVAAGGFSFRVSTAGNPANPTVVLLHGSGPGATALSNWEGALGELGETFYCVAPDILGFGDSSHPENPPQGVSQFLELRASSMIALFDVLGLTSVHLVGNSMGGMLSVRLLKLIPERIKKVVLMGTGGAPVPPTPELFKMVGFYNNPTVDEMADLLACFVYDPATFGDDLKAIAATRMPRVQREDVRRSHLATFAFVDGGPVSFSPELLGSIDHDVLLIHGREDRIVPAAVSHYFAEHLPNASLHLIGKCGHWTQIEQPKRFRALTRAFFTDAI